MATAYGTTLKNTSIPSLYNGVSEQPASLRLPSQCELQENGYPSLVDGLKKRPSSEFIAKLDALNDDTRLVHFINRDASERYVVMLGDGTLTIHDLAGNAKTVNFTAPASYLDCTDPRQELAIMTVADFTFLVNKTTVTAMDAAVTVGTAKGAKQVFSELPTSGMTLNDVYKIEGDANNTFDNYYVRWNGSTWEETTEVGIEYKFDASTMPHQLTREPDGTFTFDVIDWAERAVGDVDSVQQPSFVGRTVTDIFLHRNRLGFLSGENVILSTAPASDFSFWKESATTIIDSDPIDTPAGHSKVSTLYHASAFDRSLVLFSEQTQFILSAPNTLTPHTATLDVSTEFEASPFCHPASAGPNLYFTVPRGSHTAVREYFVQNDVTTNDAADITAHVPNYLPSGVYDLTSSSNEDILFALSTEERNAMWTYKFYWQADEKVQSSWGKWTFDEDDIILGMGMVHSDMYHVTQRPDGTYLERTTLNGGVVDTGMNVKFLLDRRTELTGSYDSGTNETTWTLPYEYEGVVEAVLGSTYGTSAGKRLSLTNVTPTTYKATGNFSSGIAYVGLPFTFRYRFSEQMMRDGSNNAIRDGRLMLRQFAVNYTDTGYFKITVSPDYRDVYTYEFTGKILGTGGFLLGALPISSGSFKFPIMSDSTQVSIEITNDSPLPSIFQSAEWVGLFHSKSSR